MPACIPHGDLLKKKPTKRRKRYPHDTVKQETILHRHPQRAKTTIEIDKGEYTEKHIVTYPVHSNIKGLTISHKRNPNILYLMKTPLKIVYYKNSKRTFVYTTEGEYCGELEKHDLKRLFSKIGQLLRYGSV